MSTLTTLAERRPSTSSIRAKDGLQALKAGSSKSLNIIGGEPAPIRSRESSHHAESIAMTPLGDSAPMKGGPSASASALSRLEGTQEPPIGFSMSTKDERIYLATLCYTLFVAGWNDATLGPLLPRIQEVYHVRSRTAFYYLAQSADHRTLRSTIQSFQSFSCAAVV